MTQQSWTKKEIDALVKNWKTMGNRELAKAVGRSVGAVKRRKYDMGLARYWSRKWINNGKLSNYRKWLNARVKAVERDEGLCQICGAKVGNSIDVHHIDEMGYRNSQNPNHDLTNLVCLCHRCHLTISAILWLKQIGNKEAIRRLVFLRLNGTSWR